MFLAEKKQTNPPARDDIAVRAPIRIGQVTLVVRDLERVARFYRDVIGLQPIVEKEGVLQLGVDGRVLISLRHDPLAAHAPAGSAGLYHIAFLLPSRNDLGAWILHMFRLGVRLTGASDHLVSEAVYLNDPEGNGIEVYADRPSATWTRIQEVIQMGADSLDLLELARSSPLRWDGMPAGGTIGHVHLQIGDIDVADSFYGKLIGFKINATIPTAHFYSAGGYHHQIAGNTWKSAGAGQRREGSLGLAEVEFLLRDRQMQAMVVSRLTHTGKMIKDEDGSNVAIDPWNIRLRLTAAPGRKQV